MTIAITIPGVPQGKGRPRYTCRSGFATAYTPPKTAAYERLVRQVYNSTCNGQKIESGAVATAIRAYYPVVKSTTKHMRARMLSGDVRPTKKPDGDNIAKVVLDALNGLAYKDDAQIVDLTVEKWYSDDPRVEVIISNE